MSNDQWLAKFAKTPEEFVAFVDKHATILPRSVEVMQAIFARHGAGMPAITYVAKIAALANLIVIGKMMVGPCKDPQCVVHRPGHIVGISAISLASMTGVDDSDLLSLSSAACEDNNDLAKAGRGPKY
jgi:hypothetical protein